MLIKYLLHAKICVQQVAMQDMQAMQVPSLGWEDSLGEEMAPHSSILAWKMLWTEEPGGLRSIASQNSQTQLSDQHGVAQQHARACVLHSESLDGIA